MNIGRPGLDTAKSQDAACKYLSRLTRGARPKGGSVEVSVRTLAAKLRSRPGVCPNGIGLLKRPPRRPCPTRDRTRLANAHAGSGPGASGAWPPEYAEYVTPCAGVDVNAGSARRPCMPSFPGSGRRRRPGSPPGNLGWISLGRGQRHPRAGVKIRSGKSAPPWPGPDDTLFARRYLVPREIRYQWQLLIEICVAWRAGGPWTMSGGQPGNSTFLPALALA